MIIGVVNSRAMAKSGDFTARYHLGATDRRGAEIEVAKAKAVVNRAQRALAKAVRDQADAQARLERAVRRGDVVLFEDKAVTVHLAPPKPKAFGCPECRLDKTKATLRFRHSTSEQWGCVVTRHDFYTCRGCRTKFVSTNGREPETTPY